MPKIVEKEIKLYVHLQRVDNAEKLTESGIVKVAFESVSKRSF
jgi:hypothetical protein